MGERSVPAACVVLVKGWGVRVGRLRHGGTIRAGCGGVGQRGREKTAETSRHICAKASPKCTVKAHSLSPSVPSWAAAPTPPPPHPQHWEHLAPKSNLPPIQVAPLHPSTPPSVPLCGRWALCVTAGSLGHIHMGQGSAFVCVCV